jgi:hypothetical protein
MLEETLSLLITLILLISCSWVILGNGSKGLDTDDFALSRLKLVLLALPGQVTLALPLFLPLHLLRYCLQATF